MQLLAVRLASPSPPSTPSTPHRHTFGWQRQQCCQFHRFAAYTARFNYSSREELTHFTNRRRIRRSSACKKPLSALTRAAVGSINSAELVVTTRVNDVCVIVIVVVFVVALPANESPNSLLHCGCNEVKGIDELHFHSFSRLTVTRLYNYHYIHESAVMTWKYVAVTRE